MKLLTFLGAGSYFETQYTWQEQSFASQYAPAASCRFLQASQVIAFLTEEAQDKVFESFKASLPPEVSLQPIPVPLGKDQAELWQLFSQVSQAVQPEETIAFDITHGLRSFPLVGLLAAAYLHAGFSVELKAVLYGAYDVGRQVSPGFTPMFDLTPMLTLLEWAVAADRSKRTGDARYLASLVKAMRKDLVLAAGEDKAQIMEIGRLGNLADTLECISKSLRLIRPHQAMQQAAGLPERIQRAQPALQRVASVLPFNLLLQDLAQAYQPLALENPAEPHTLHETLHTERLMIRWYAEREQWVQAVSLAREWLVSWVMLQLGLADFTHLSSRQRIEHAVGAEAADYRQSCEKKTPFQPLFLKDLPNIERLMGLWLALTEVRNDIDHAGMRRDPGKPDDLVRRILDCLQILEDIPL